MKKFAKLLALGMAMALTFGMTVSATEVTDPATDDEGQTEYVPENPSAQSGIFVTGFGGVHVSAYTDEILDEVWTSAKIAAYGNLAIGEKLKEAGKIVDPRNATIELKEVVNISVELINGGVSIAPEVTDYRIPGEGRIWGVALYNLKSGKLTQVDMVLDDGLYGKVVVDYEKGLQPDKNGSPYALVVWHLNQWYDSFQTNVQAQNGLVWDHPYTDHVARAQQFLWPQSSTNPLGRDLGNKLAKQCGDLYGFQRVVGSAKLTFATQGDYVAFDLPTIAGDHKYIVMLFPYNTVDGYLTVPGRAVVANPYGPNDWPNFDIDEPYTVVLKPDVNLADNRTVYSATINKGTWLATVFEVAEDPKNVPADPTPVVSANATTAAAGANTSAGVQAAGVVSPKTGEMLPVAVILAVICLAGAAVCAKKARNNA